MVKGWTDQCCLALWMGWEYRRKRACNTRATCLPWSNNKYVHWCVPTDFWHEGKLVCWFLKATVEHENKLSISGCWFSMANLLEIAWKVQFSTSTKYQQEFSEMLCNKFIWSEQILYSSSQHTYTVHLFKNMLWLSFNLKSKHLKQKVCRWKPNLWWNWKNRLHYMNDSLLVLAGKTASRLLLDTDYPILPDALTRKHTTPPYTGNDL